MRSARRCNGRTWIAPSHLSWVREHIAAVSGFGGIVRFDSSPGGRSDAQQIGRGLRVPGGAGATIWSGGPAALCHRAFAYTAEDLLDRQPRLARGGRLAFVAAGRIDNREEIAADLGLGPPELRRMGDAELMLAAWDRWNAAAAPRLL